VRIARAAALSGLSPRQIRYYQELGVLAEGGRARGQHREFTDRDVRRLRMLKTLLAADLAPALAARVGDGTLTVGERAQVERLLDRHLVAVQQTRAGLATAGPVEPTADHPDISLMFDIYVLRSRMGASLTAALAEAGVTSSEYALLSLLQGAGPSTAGEMAARLGVSTAALGRQLAELVRRDWALRRAGPGRRVTFALTPIGEQRFDAALPLAAGVARQLDQGLRERGTDPDVARAVLQTLSATLVALPQTTA
jgi:DNA-binding transcriptional MerR regulator/DNA-binding HxlR family transcriptional regulator